MRTPLSDTDAETDRVHVAMLRRATPARRLRLALSLSGTVIALSRSSRVAGAPRDREEAGVRFVEVSYGRALAAGVRERLRSARS
jgi:hypothetical protein